jgi:hypothetical protein
MWNIQPKHGFNGIIGLSAMPRAEMVLHIDVTIVGNG